MTDDIAILSNLLIRADGAALVAPCVECTFYFRHAPMTSLQDFAERALSALDGQLTRFITGSMRKHAARGKKSENSFQLIFEQPRVGTNYWLEFHGDGLTQGTSAATLQIIITPPPPPPTTEAEIAAQIAASYERYEVEGGIFSPGVNMIRATFPLDHPLAKADAMLAWVRELDCVKHPSFVSGQVGYALNVDRGVGVRAQQLLQQSTLAAALARHPGLGYEHFGSVAAKLLKYWPGHAEFLPRFKRVQWLTFVRNLMLDELCGGRAQVEAQLDGQDGILCHDLGDGLMIKAGAAPAIGDVTTRDDLPAYRRVAGALADARLPRFKGIGSPFTDDAAQRWLDALETDLD